MPPCEARPLSRVAPKEAAVGLPAFAPHSRLQLLRTWTGSPGPTACPLTTAIRSAGTVT